MININFTVRDKQVYVGQAKYIIVPTIDGEITIMAEHIALISVIRSGELHIVDMNDNRHSYAITRGVLEVRPGDNIILLCDDAIYSQDIDIQAEESAIARAEQIMAGNESFEDVSGLTSPLERELNRIRISGKRSKI